MIAGPCQLLVLSKTDVVASFQELMGPESPETAKAEAPESLRALYGTDDIQNAVYGSVSAEAAFREIDVFFPGEDRLRRKGETGPLRTNESACCVYRVVSCPLASGVDCCRHHTRGEHGRALASHC